MERKKGNDYLLSNSRTAICDQTRLIKCSWLVVSIQAEIGTNKNKNKKQIPCHLPRPR